LAEAIAQADLDRDALCGAEFVIGHGATPYRNGRVLHSVFAAALSFFLVFGSAFIRAQSSAVA
ncbi:hypothetical protein JTM05_02965, partial [Pseudomonas aeruginosa]|nr:hypothetical protein [Pseudomonas aeruginosa]